MDERGGSEKSGQDLIRVPLKGKLSVFKCAGVGGNNNSWHEVAPRKLAFGILLERIHMKRRDCNAESPNGAVKTSQVITAG